MPPALASARFAGVWDRWKSYHEENGKPLTPTRARAHLEDLADRGEAAATEALLSAMMRGWQSPAKTDKGAKVKGAVADLDPSLKRRRAEMGDKVNASAALLESAKGGATA